MTTTQFKQKYSQYKNLEGDELWDKMTLSLLESDNVLYADSNQIKTFHEPIDTEYGKITIEDSSTTRWLNKDGELVRIGEPIRNAPTKSYRMDIIDFSKL